MKAPFLLHQLLAESAQEVPDATAVRSRSQQLSYRELDRLTDGLAAMLQARGLKRGDRVGIYVPKSLASVVSIYSILKAGGVYVPFDPDAPPDRLSYIAKDCDVRILLTCSQKTKRVDEIISKDSPVTTVVLVDCDQDGEKPIPWTPQNSKVSAIGWDKALSNGPPSADVGGSEADTAYILYTSGSTGVPKGVMISHRNSLAFVEWAAECIGLKSGDVVACHAPLHFDISTFSIFSACRAGASTLMIPERAATFPAELSKMIEAERVTVWYSVPSVLTLMILYGDLPARDLSNLRAVVFAGEVFPVKFLRQLMSVIPHARFLNWYGPTETNVCTSYEVTGLLPDSASLPIGKASSGDEVFALTNEGNTMMVPGETGELYVRGPTVMQGYWNDPQKTQAVLVKDPLNPTSEEKVVRTGDFVGIDQDGNYLYFGRKDGMVKTRGYRVELGEIEAALYSHPEVNEVAVVPVKNELAGNLLHAFVSLHEGSPLTEDKILAYCAARLPKYMVPDAVSIEAALPKTSSGKTDRVALSARVSGGVKG